MTEDPIKDGTNWYQYCGGDPVNYVDPNGLILNPVLDTLFYTAISNAISGNNQKNSAQELTKEIKKVIRQKDTQPGSPDDRGRTDTTWCNRAAERVLTEMGYDTSPILNDSPTTGKPDIGWTNANAMAQNAAEAAEQGIIKEVTPEKAQELANQGIPILAIQDNSSIDKKGHAGIVAPSDEPYDPNKGPYIGQAGAENRFDYASESFRDPENESQKVHYYQLDKKNK